LDNIKEGHVSNDKKRFTKNIGIVFIEPLKWNWTKHRLIFDKFVEYLYRKKPKHKLNFDQLAAAHFLLQMNRVQSLFDFQVITIQLFENFRLPAEHTKGLDGLLEWLDGEVCNFENGKGKGYNIDYWFGITSVKDEYSWFYKISKKEGKRSGKWLGIITSYRWEEMHYSPPSLFEYVPLSLFICSLSCLNRDYSGPLHSHSYYRTKGCIFDFFPY
jgi:hypothetical protein